MHCKIDTPSILFFLGILLSIGVLQATGVLNNPATLMSEKIGNISAITMSIGLLSAIVDNAPLVAAVQGMYPLEQYPTGHYFRIPRLLFRNRRCVLIIGSAAGVAAMGLERSNSSGISKRSAGWH